MVIAVVATVDVAGRSRNMIAALEVEDIGTVVQANGS